MPTALEISTTSKKNMIGTTVIPRLIHQTYKSEAQIPLEWQESPRSWRQYHPSWIYCFWSDQDLRQLVQDHYSWFLPLYDSLKYTIQRIDAARYMILHRHGGVYSDLDYRVLCPIDQFFQGNDNNHAIYLVVSCNDGGYSNSLIASPANSPFWIECLKEIEHRVLRQRHEWWNLEKHVYVLHTTGPAMIRDLVKRPPYNSWVSTSAIRTVSAQRVQHLCQASVPYG